MTALAFPGFCFTIFCIVNMSLADIGSSAAIPFGTWISLLGLWLGIDFPLVLCGSYLALRKQVPDVPISPSNIPKKISTVSDENKI